MNQDPALKIHLECTPDSGAKFASLFQRGFLVPSAGFSTISELLYSLPGFTSHYLEEKVQTLFINGSAADSLDMQVKPGDTMALSAAMPGLAGAIFRRGGQHGSLRSQPTIAQSTGKTGFITLKLFNTISIERSDDLLANGILVASRPLSLFLERHEQGLLPCISGLTVDNSSCTLAQLQEYLFTDPERIVHLSTTKHQ